VDVAKGIRMFARMAVPCAAVAENMSYFDGDDGRRYHPFGRGSGDRVMRDFGLPHLVRFPILPELSAAGDGACVPDECRRGRCLRVLGVRFWMMYPGREWHRHGTLCTRQSAGHEICQGLRLRLGPAAPRPLPPSP
jgi:hypothetical protein